jgi:deoxynucleotide monophosphate kinase-like protein
MLIGLNGNLKAGKDTTYEIIRQFKPEAERVSFADLLKDSAADSIGMSRGLLEWLKGEEEFKFTIKWEGRGNPYENGLSHALRDELNTWEMTARQYMQWYGTEGHRTYFGENIWVDAALPVDLDHSQRFIVVTDMRFPNEVERVQNLGGVTVKIMRGVETAFSNHPSEQNIDDYIDAFIDNNGTKQELAEKVQRFLFELPNLEARARSRRIHSRSENLLEA